MPSMHLRCTLTVHYFWGKKLHIRKRATLQCDRMDGVCRMGLHAKSKMYRGIEQLVVWSSISDVFGIWITLPLLMRTVQYHHLLAETKTWVQYVQCSCISFGDFSLFHSRAIRRIEIYFFLLCCECVTYENMSARLPVSLFHISSNVYHLRVCASHVHRVTYSTFMKWDEFVASHFLFNSSFLVFFPALVSFGALWIVIRFILDTAKKWYNWNGIIFATEVKIHTTTFPIRAAQRINDEYMAALLLLLLLFDIHIRPGSMLVYLYLPSTSYLLSRHVLLLLYIIIFPFSLPTSLPSLYPIIWRHITGTAYESFFVLVILLKIIHS